MGLNCWLRLKHNIEEHILVNTNLVTVYGQNSVKLSLLLFLIRGFAEVLQLKAATENSAPFRSCIGT